MSNTMNAMDAISGSQAECYITIDGRRYNFMSIHTFEAKWEVNIVEVPILGRTSKGHKPAGGNGTWSGTAHFNQSIMRDILLQYKDTGKFVYFDIQVTNEDPSSAAGRQTVILKDCLVEGGVLAKFEQGADYLEEEMSGTFDDFEIPEKFKVLAGM